MTDDRARRNRVAAAIRDAFHNSDDLFVKFPVEASQPFDEIAEAAIAAMDEPEPTPQLLVDMADAMRASKGVCVEGDGEHTHSWTADYAARAALGVVFRKLRSTDGGFLEVGTIAVLLGIPESLVRELIGTGGSGVS